MAKTVVLALILFLGSFFLFTLSARSFDTNDSYPTDLTAFSLIFYHRTDLTPLYKLMVARHIGDVAIVNDQGQFYAKTPVILGILSVPTIWAANTWFGVNHLTGTQTIYSEYGQYIGKLSGAFYTSVSGVVLFLFLVGMTKKNLVSFFLTCVYFFASNLFNTASQANWQHGISLFLILVFLYGVTFCPDRKWLVLILGGLIGLLAQIRISNGFYFLFPLVYWFLSQKNRRKLWRQISYLFIGAFLIFFLITLAYYYYHVPYGYGSEIKDSLTQLSLISPVISLLTILFSFNYGFFFFSPVFLFSLGGITFLSSAKNKGRLEKVTYALLPCLAVFLLFLSTWKYYLGGVSLNARLLSETLPIWVLLLTVFWLRSKSYFLKVVLTGLFVYSIFVNILTTYFMDWLWFPYYIKNTPASQARGAWFHSPILLVYLAKRRVLHLERMYRRGDKIYIWRGDWRFLTGKKLLSELSSQQYATLDLKQTVDNP